MKAATGAMLITLAVVHSLGAQTPSVADSLLQGGSLARAESLYYAAVRAKPRDPAARRGLGRYLVARGATKVGVTLLEEAIRFGGDASSINAELAPLYLTLADYHSLAALTPFPLGTDERDRARWLEAHPTRVIAPDSVVIATYRPSNDSAYLGTMPIGINGRVVDVLISASSAGITVSDSIAKVFGLRRFNSRATQGGVGAADSVSVGRLTLTNVPLRIASGRTSVVIGLDVLRKFAPTFEPAAGRVTLRTSGSAPAGLTGDRFATWSMATDVRVLQRGAWISVGNPTIARLLAERTWTLDTKRGEVVLGK